MQEAVAGIAKGGAVKGEGANALDRLLPDNEKDWDDGRKPAQGKKPLIEEVEPAPKPDLESGQPKSILKNSPSAVVEPRPKQLVPPVLNAGQKEKEKELLIPLDLSWDWEKLESSGKLRVTIHIPDLVRTYASYSNTYLTPNSDSTLDHLWPNLPRC